MRKKIALINLCVAVAVVATVAGSVIAGHTDRPAGPIIITIAALMFLVTLLGRRR